MPRNSEAYRCALARIRAVWSGVPCDMTVRQKSEIYAPLTGLGNRFRRDRKGRRFNS